MANSSTQQRCAPSVVCRLQSSLQRASLLPLWMSLLRQPRQATQLFDEARCHHTRGFTIWFASTNTAQCSCFRIGVELSLERVLNAVSLYHRRTRRWRPGSCWRRWMCAPTGNFLNLNQILLFSPITHSAAGGREAGVQAAAAVGGHVLRLHLFANVNLILLFSRHSDAGGREAG